MPKPEHQTHLSHEEKLRGRTLSIDEETLSQEIRHNDQIYALVKNHRPDLWARCVEIGHIAMIQGNVSDEVATKIEAACMLLVAEAIAVKG